MPEGDSVLRVARRLDRRISGLVLARSDFRHPRWATVRLDGRRVVATVSVGKHLLTRVEGGVTIHTHLRMDGEWTVLAPGKRLPARLQPDVRVELATTGPDGGPGPTALALRLPVVEVLPTADEDSVVGHLGPDVLADDWDPAAATARILGAPDRPVKAALLDQRNLAGLGNLWADELCFLRGHSPWTPVSAVDLPALLALARRMLLFSGTPVRVVAEVPGDPERRRTWWCPSCQPGPGPSD